ncbi:hypothetical protein HYX17_00790 [Candidatus Woesearchaeota archaeon]|nr:hypothetical protein [Candidatus Woesearchaeota archaeon]
MDKKGVSNVLVYLIYSTIVLIVLIIIIVYVWKPIVVETADDYFCLFSVVIRSFGGNAYLDKIPFIEEIIPRFETSVPLVCKMHSKLVKDKEDAKKVIAKEMANCWGRMGEGKFDIYSTIKSPIDFWDKNNICFICSRIRSNDNIILSSEEMISYLGSKQPRPLLDKRNYLDYITGTGYERLKLEDRVRGIGNFEIKQDKSLFVVYFVNRGESLIRKFTRGAGTATAAFLVLPGKGTQIHTLAVLTAGFYGTFAQSKGFNTNIIAADAQGVKDLCTSFG